MPSGKQATLIVWFVGMSVLIGLTIWYGADHVGSAMVSAGWACVLVVLARIVAVGIAGGGWWLLFPHGAAAVAGSAWGFVSSARAPMRCCRSPRSAAISSARGAWRCAASAARWPPQASSSTC